LTEATLTAPISRASLATVEEAGQEADQAAAWVELVRGGNLDAGQCAICERKDGPFEEHHVAGKLNSDLLVQVCKDRCHPRLSERQNGWDPRWQLADNPPKLKETFLLRGLSDLCEERGRHFGPEYHRLGKRLRAVYALRARETI
jgi:hypothetical protein